MRKPLPDRRHSWTQKAHIGGQTLYVGFGEYEDRSLGEIFIDASKQGTFLRGVLGALARSISLALQCGATADELANALRGLDFPPNGPVIGSPVVSKASSLVDWIAAEVDAVYGAGVQG